MRYRKGLREMNVLTRYEQYVLNCIDFDGYDIQANTAKQKIQAFIDCFYSEYSHEIKRQGSVQKAIEEYLRGLPSHTNIDFYNHDILKRAVEFKALPENATEKQEDKILDKYWSFMAMRIMSLCNKHNVKIDR